MDPPAPPAGLAREKERTLRIAWLLSAWAPLAGGVALYFGPSTILLADLLRRSSELLALFLAWLVFLRIARSPAASPATFHRQQHLASLLVAVVMLFSMIVIAWSAIGRVREDVAVGWIVPGLCLAMAGGCVNGWLWRRNRDLARREPGPLIDSQWSFYRTKTVIDVCVIVTLLLGAATRDAGFSPWVDAAGSAVIALCLLVAARRIGHAALAGLRHMPADTGGAQ